MSVKLIAKRRLAFRNPEDKKFITVMPHVFETVPDWVRKDPIFQWGVQDGTITVADPPPHDKPEEKPADKPEEKPKGKSSKGSK